MSDVVVRGYQRWIATRAGFLLFSSVVPGIFLVLAATQRIDRIAATFRLPMPSTSDERMQRLLLLAYLVLSLLFYCFLVLVYARRRPLLRPVGATGGLLAALGGSFLPFALVGLPRTVTAIAPNLLAVLLMVTGMATSLVALTSLRRNFGILPEVRGLVRDGLYRWVRHPVYTGEFITVAGIALPLWSAPAVAIYVGFVLLQYWRTCYEESALSQQFPDYQAYRSTARRFFPRPW